MSFAAFVEICEEDAHWIPQFIAEVERLQMPFGIHLDRCSAAVKDQLCLHPLCVASMEMNDPEMEYTEQHKQQIFDLLSKQRKYKWLVHWNIDEIWEKDAPTKFASIADRIEDYLQVGWVNCWGTKEYIRVDTIFCNALRVKLYNISEGRIWRFDHPITHGCKLMGNKQPIHDSLVYRGIANLVCIHTGLMTRELREQHKERWDRIYTKAVGANPYGMWSYCLDEETYPPTIIPNPYL